MTRWIETDNLSNQNISSALAIGSYTADADRSILCQFFADQVAGEGDYIFYLTLQIGGAGSAYVMLPKTTGAAAAGETALGGQSIIVNVRSGDVLIAYLKGLVGDDTTPDTSVRWFELAALRPTTIDRTLDVSAGGEAGIDWANVGTPATVLDLSGTTVKAVTDAEADIAAVDAKIDIVQADLDDPNQYKADVSGVSTSVELAAVDTKINIIDGIVDAVLIDTGTTIPAQVAVLDVVADAIKVVTDKVDDTLEDDLGIQRFTANALEESPAGGGPIAEDVWSYAVRTLTQSAASIIEVLTGTTINIYRGDTFNATITGLGSLVGYTSTDIAIKADRADADSEAIIWIRKNASEEDDGLLRVNGAAPISPLLGSIAIDSELLGNITVTLDETITAILAPVSGLSYDIQMISADGIVTLGQGLCNVGADVVRAVV